ncbi:MAG: 2-methylcitrate dehydratase, partial [Dehalococcoidia bacterium]
FGELSADHYEDAAAADPRIDALREKMTVAEEPRYSRDYLDPDKRAIANAVQIWFRDGSSTERVAVEYPLGHRRRRADAVPQLFEKLRDNLATRLPADRAGTIVDLCRDQAALEVTPVPEFVELFLP